jgi:hypothetical protein
MELFTGAFAKLRKATTTFIMSVCLSLRPRKRTQLPLSGFSLTLMSEHYSKLFWRNTRTTKI